MISTYPRLRMPSTIGCQMAKTWKSLNPNWSIVFAHAVSSHLIQETMWVPELPGPLSAVAGIKAHHICG